MIAGSRSHIQYSMLQQKQNGNHIMDNNSNAMALPHLVMIDLRLPTLSMLEWVG